MDKLERQNRRLKLIGTVVMVLAAAVLLMGQASQKKTVEANEFILKDTTGKTRARLGIGATGPDLAMFDTEGKARASLEVENDTTGTVTLYKDSSGKDVVAHNSYGGGALKMFDREGKARVILEVKNDIKENVQFKDGSGKDVVVPMQSGGGSLTLGGTGELFPGRTTLREGKLDLLKNGNDFGLSSLDALALNFSLNTKFGSLVLNGDKGNIVLKDKDGFETSIGTTDLVTTRTGETHKTSGASVVLFDKDKKVLWQAP
jgi:hypothetical protein